MRRRSSHRRLLQLLLSVGLLATLAGAGACWLDRQTLDTPRWSSTSARTIQNADVRDAIAAFIARQALAGGVDQGLSSALPGFLADRLESGLRDAASGVARGVLASPSGRRAWVSAAVQSQRELLAQLGHPRRAAQPIAIDLAPLLRDLLQGLARAPLARAIPGASAALAAVPLPSGRLQILPADQVRTLRGPARRVRLLAWTLPLAALLAFGLALMLAAGERLRTLTRVGYRILIAGGLLLGVRPLARIPLGRLLVHGHENRLAVEATWMIGTGLLRTEALWLLFAGAVIGLGSWGLRLLRG